MAINAANVINEGLQKTAQKAKNILLKGVGEILKKTGAKEQATKIETFDMNTNWNPEIIKSAFDKAMKKLQDFEEPELNFAIRWHLLKLCNLEPPVQDEKIIERIISKAGKPFNINPKNYIDLAAAEAKIFQKAVEEQIELLQKTLANMGAEEQEQFEEILNEELKKLSEADLEAIKRVTGLEKLSARALSNFLRTTSSVVLAQIIIGGWGFGAYLFLTAFLKAVSLFFGITFAFSTYTAASSMLAFLLSGPFVLLVSALTGGVLYFQTTRKLDQQLAKMLIMAGKGNLIKLGHQ